MFYDVHAHLDYKEFDNDVDAVVKRAEDAGVIAILNNGLSPESNRKTLELAKKYKIVKPVLGLYPSEALHLEDSEIDAEIDFISKQKILAIGEIGLDFFKVSNHEKQEEVFRKFIQLAIKMDAPLIVHSRGAEERAFEILQEENAKRVVMHCFSGSLELVEKIEKAGYFFSIPVCVVFNETFQQLVKQVSITKLLTETDSPFLGPVRGQRNEPKNVLETVKKISEIKNLDFDETKKNLFTNFRSFFQIETFL